MTWRIGAPVSRMDMAEARPARAQTPPIHLPSWRRFLDVVPKTQTAMKGSPGHVRRAAAISLAAAFTIELVNDDTVITAEAPSAENAVSFVCDLHECEEVLGSVWHWQGGRWIMTLHDVEDAWSLETPALARIIAPPGFQPPPGPAGSLV